MTVTVLERSPSQRMAALRQANSVRVHRAQMKVALKAQGCQLAAELVAAPPWWLETMRVENLLVSLPWFGESKMRAVLRMLSISQAKTVGGLSSRQRVELVAELERRAQA